MRSLPPTVFLLLLAVSSASFGAPLCSEVFRQGLQPTWQLRWLISEDKTVSNLVKSITGNATDKNINIENLSSVLDAAVSHPELLQTNEWPDTTEYVQAAQSLRSRLLVFQSAVRRLQNQKKDSPEMVLTVGRQLFSDVADSIYDLNFDQANPAPHELIQSASQVLVTQKKAAELLEEKVQAEKTPVANKRPNKFSVKTELKSATDLIAQGQVENSLKVLNQIWWHYSKFGVGPEIEENPDRASELILTTTKAFEAALHLYKDNVKQKPDVRDLAVVINGLPNLDPQYLRLLSPSAQAQLITLRIQLKDLL
jgi:hypothetical protein